MTDEIPVEVGIVHEGERIRGPEMFLELGGPKVKYKAELVQARKSEEIEDGKVILIGKDIPEFKEGDRISFGILVEVYGRKVEKDLESVIERRVHDFLNYIQGFMHLNQRYDIWCRVSKEAKEKGLKFEHVGKAILNLFKTEYSFIEKSQITFITDERKVKGHYDKAMKIYGERDKRIRGMKDEEVDVFYACTLCQSFAPNHVCIISPQRVSLCGSISWLDARAAAKVDPDGPNFAVPKGELLDEINGEYSGVNEAIKEATNGANERFYMYSLFKFPHTSCGCFEAIAFYVPEVDGIGMVDRNFTGAAVNGLKFSAMATQTGGGEQTEGFLGFGIEWMYSAKFFFAEDGWNRIVWMPSHIKERVKDAIPKELYDKIPTEKEVTNLEELKKFLQEKGHSVAERWASKITDELKDKVINYIQEKEGEIYPEEASKDLGITEDELMKVIDKLQEEGVLE